MYLTTNGTSAVDFGRSCPHRQLLAEETEGLIMTSLSAMRADLTERPAWSGAPPPADNFLLMFLRAEVFSAAKAADRYRKFWEV